ncbi:hypothetical protein PTTG_12370 [Puccinia triticina 1-1 BBBD Race 1]|uniref:Cytochrome c oxidase assembly protein COX20, mitochondrial n=1 Tax=Puccinia triticina (isolate 1-1 / race 1 (BBBD)) TaxID=630390 RepID=A0A180GVC6_PUCT1|nr:hypothetical protein PTTG_12370 [Puccinia triticina 1-1 BBBD Race 1]
MAATTSLPPPAPRPTAWEALQSFNLNDSLQERFARVPSQRKALMFGMAGGTCIGALRFISTRPSEGERLSEEKTTTADQTQNKKKYWLW